MWMGADGRSTRCAYGRDEGCVRVSMRQFICPVGGKSAGGHKVRVCLYSLECERARPH